MIRFYLLYFTLSCSLAFSQQEASVWYFGENAGVKFNNNGSLTTLTDGQLYTSEGCATIADNNGNLLFYTDGITVWNRNHQVMSNGNGLMGNFSSTQSATIVPLPGSNNLYYIFTLDYEVHVNGFRYSIVDMNLNGGLGDVTSSKNVLIYTPSNEKLSVVKHANNTDYWIVTHGWNNNSFYSYLLTSSGLSNTPVISNVGAVVNGSTENVYGNMKISPDGSKLAICNSHIDAELMDFNNATGIISNPIVLTTNSMTSGFCYGVEFSPNSKLLYLSNILYLPAPVEVIQYDLTSSNIPLSAQTIFSSQTTISGSLQLGPDKKIYIAELFMSKLGVINNPDTVGLGCNIQMDAIDLSGKICELGLPPFVSSFFNATFKTQNLCYGNSTQFTIDTNQTVLNASWNFGDGNTSNSISPTHQFASPGTFLVTVATTTALGTSVKSNSVTIYDMPVANLISNQTVCGNSTINYDLSQHNATIYGSQSTSIFGIAYFASLSDLTSNTNALPNIYSLPMGVSTIYYKIYNLASIDCYDFNSFTITKYLKPISNTVSDIFICDDSSNDGIGNFDLNTKTSLILGTQSSTDFKVSYYLSQADATSGSNPLVLNYQNISNPQTIFVRVENRLSSNCFDVTTSFQIGLYAMPIANPVSDLYMCDAGNDGIESFDISIQTPLILGSQSSNNFNVTYYDSLNDANQGLNPINNIQTAQNSKTIYARIENKISFTCFATTSFQLIVKPKPVVVIQDSYSICQGNQITVVAPTGFDTYSWSTGSNTNSTIITQAGNYSVTVTKDYGTIICDETKNFTVYSSNVATITSIETHDWTDNENDIVVYVAGDVNDYLYSLDNIHFQDSNQFYGLISGDYTVYVKDKKGCGTVQDEVFLLMYPKFFTPNGDGFNDLWKIKFSSKESNMLIYIYDRYGKMIKMFSGLSSGWDGTLEGELLPSDDYWFVVKRQNDKEYKGHFALKR